MSRRVAVDQLPAGGGVCGAARTGQRSLEGEFSPEPARDFLRSRCASSGRSGSGAKASRTTTSPWRRSGHDVRQPPAGCVATASRPVDYELGRWLSYPGQGINLPERFCSHAAALWKIDPPAVDGDELDRDAFDATQGLAGGSHQPLRLREGLMASLAGRNENAGSEKPPGSPPGFTPRGDHFFLDFSSFLSIFFSTCSAPGGSIALTSAPVVPL